MSNAYVSYLRVSTKDQGVSGYGIEAQRDDVAKYIANRGTVSKEYVEIESGKNNARIQLAKAIDLCKVTRSILIIAKLDRLSRDAIFLLELQKSDVEFVCCDMPDANALTIGIMAIVAQNEREAISARTKAALAAAKARGVRMGRRPGLPSLMPAHASALGVKVRQAKSLAHAERLRPHIDQWITDGLSLTQMVNELNNGKFTTSRGLTGKWQMVQLQIILGKLGLD